jgi:hypothetical protein
MGRGRGRGRRRRGRRRGVRAWELRAAVVLVVVDLGQGK